MAKRDTPRSMLQAFIENVPTTAPVKRTRPRSRSPVEKMINETIPSQRKRRRRSSLAVKQTPRTMIESYMYDHKTQTPFVRASRRRSETVTPFSQTGIDPIDTVTPRTALEGYLHDAPEETPFQNTLRPEENSELENSELESESDMQHLPNETIHVTHSPIDYENTGNIALSQKERRQNQGHITLQQFSKGINNLTRADDLTGEQMFSSDDDEYIPDIPLDTTINVLVNSLSSEDDQEQIILPQKDKRQNKHHITLMEFSQGLKNTTALSEMRRDQSSQSFVSPTKSTLPLIDDLDLTPSQRTRSLNKVSGGLDLTPSQRSIISNNSATPQIASESDLTSSRRQMANDSDLTPSRRETANESDLTPSRRQMENASDLIASRREMAIESDLTPSRRIVVGNMSAKGQVMDIDLTPSKRTRTSNRLGRVLDTETVDLTPSRRHETSNRLLNIISGQSDITPSKKYTANRTIQLETSHGSDLTPSKRNTKTKYIDPEENDLTPSHRRRTQSRLGNISLQDLTPSKTKSPNMSRTNKGLDETDPGPSSTSLNRLFYQQDSQESDLSPSKRRTSIRHTSQESKLTSSQTVDESETHDNSNESGLAKSRLDRSLDVEDRTDLTRSQRTKRSDMSQGSPIKTPRNVTDSIKKNSQKPQNRIVENVLDVEPDENIQNQKAGAGSVIRGQGKAAASRLQTPVRTALTSNITVLENIKPLSSSTPARVLKDKLSTSSTPNRIAVKSTSGTPTPRRVPIRTGTTKKTPSRILTSHSSVNMSNNASLSSHQLNSMSASYTSKGDGVLENNTDEGRSFGLSRKMDTQRSEKMVQQDTENIEDDEEIDEEDTAEIYKLKTPHLQQNISRIPTPIYSSTPAPTRTIQRPKPTPAKPISRKRQETNSKLTSTMLPNNIIKQAFQHFSNMKVAPDTMNELVKFTDTYFENTFSSLEAFALHGGRKTIDESDVELMMRRQGLITEKQPLNVLVENILPLELRQEIIPIARANNVVVPL